MVLAYSHERFSLIMRLAAVLLHGCCYAIISHYEQCLTLDRGAAIQYIVVAHRFWEARKVWGSVTNTVRNLTRLSQSRYVFVLTVYVHLVIVALQSHGLYVSDTYSYVQPNTSRSQHEC
jgi:hypothetical protein